MILHDFTKKWKWFYGRYAPSGIRVWRKLRKKRRVWKKGLYSVKILVWMKKPFFTKGSTNRWIWHLYNVFRSAKPIQIQPINPNLINQRKIAKKIRIWFEISRIFFIYCPRCLLLHRVANGCDLRPSLWISAMWQPLHALREEYGTTYSPQGRHHRGIGRAI